MLLGNHYVVNHPLKQGGSSAVFVGHDINNPNRLYAIKRISINQSSLHDSAIDEARVLINLLHPALPRIEAYFAEVGFHVLVMMLVHGQDLSESLSYRYPDGRERVGKAFSAPQVVQWGIEICSVLEYLGSMRDPRSGQPAPVLHLDIKPNNLVLETATGRLHLVDFSAARVAAGYRPGGPLVSWSGKLSGTAGYAAPEQYRHRASPRSDVYALAVTMYQLLTDKVPLRLTSAPPDLFPGLDLIPPDLRAVLRRAWAAEERRRLDATQFRQELEGIKVD